MTEHFDLRVQGMTCAACVARVERKLGKLAGVQAATVNLATERAGVDYLAAQVSPELIKAAIRDAGYEPVEIAERRDHEAEAREAEQAALRRDLRLALAFTLPVVFLAMGPMVVPGLDTAMARLLPRRSGTGSNCSSPRPSSSSRGAVSIGKAGPNCATSAPG